MSHSFIVTYVDHSKVHSRWIIATTEAQLYNTHNITFNSLNFTSLSLLYCSIYLIILQLLTATPFTLCAMWMYVARVCDCKHKLTTLTQPTLQPIAIFTPVAKCYDWTKAEWHKCDCVSNLKPPKPKQGNNTLDRNWCVRCKVRRDIVYVNLRDAIHWYCVVSL